eukprot:jgi/Mesvir1/313/Mv22725-RA.2
MSRQAAVRKGTREELHDWCYSLLQPGSPAHVRGTLKQALARLKGRAIDKTERAEAGAEGKRKGEVGENREGMAEAGSAEAGARPQEVHIRTGGDDAAPIAKSNSRDGVASGGEGFHPGADVSNLPAHGSADVSKDGASRPPPAEGQCDETGTSSVDRLLWGQPDVKPSAGQSGGSAGNNVAGVGSGAIPWAKGHREGMPSPGMPSSSAIEQETFCPDAEVDDALLQCLLAAAPFSTSGDTTTVFSSSSVGAGPGGAPAGSLSREGFDSWVKMVPCVPLLLASLLEWPVPHLWPDTLLPKGAPTLQHPSGRKTYILQWEHFVMLAAAIPHAQRHAWRLLYSSTLHGQSFSSLHARLTMAGMPTLVVVRDTGGAIFGGYASQPWLPRSSTFYGDSHSFVFTLSPAVAVYRATGDNASFQWLGANFQSSEALPNGVGFGGSTGRFGMFVADSVDAGTSLQCRTYGSPCLASSAKFSVAALECWGTLPDGDQGGAEGGSVSGGSAGAGGGASVLDRFRQDKAVMQLMGIGFDSESIGARDKVE